MDDRGREGLKFSRQLTPRPPVPAFAEKILLKVSITMTKFTTKQQAFIDARIAGHNITQSAIAAGYSPAGANRQGSALEKLPKVKRAIAAGKKQSRVTDHIKSTMGVPGRRKTKGNAGEEEEPRMLDEYTDSLHLLRHTYNNPRMPDSIRLRAAEQALPYEHGRVGEKGKKQQRQDAAKEVMGKGEGKRTRLQPIAPPALRVVGGSAK